MYFILCKSRQPPENCSLSPVFKCMDHYSLDETLVSLNQHFLCEYKFVYSMKVTFICTWALGNNPFYQGPTSLYLQNVSLWRVHFLTLPY